MTKFEIGSRWRMRGGEIAVVECHMASGHICATWPGMSSVFKADGRYWFHGEESEFDLLDEVQDDQRTAS